MISSKLFEKCFSYSSPSNMCKALNETTGQEESKAQVNTIENSSFTSDTKNEKQHAGNC